VGEVAAGGRTVFFSTHLLSDIEAVADTVGIVENGRMLLSEDLDRLRETHALVRAVYDERPPEDEVNALRRLPGVGSVEREGRAVRLRVVGDVEAVVRTMEARPHRIVDVDATGMSLEDIFVAYVEEAGDGR
jgi:ABC-2 type transport system ATP-binding protein